MSSNFWSGSNKEFASADGSLSGCMAESRVLSVTTVSTRSASSELGLFKLWLWRPLQGVGTENRSAPDPCWIPAFAQGTTGFTCSLVLDVIVGTALLLVEIALTSMSGRQAPGGGNTGLGGSGCRGRPAGQRPQVQKSRLFRGPWQP